MRSWRFAGSRESSPTVYLAASLLLPVPRQPVRVCSDHPRAEQRPLSGPVPPLRPCRAPRCFLNPGCRMKFRGASPRQISSPHLYIMQVNMLRGSDEGGVRRGVGLVGCRRSPVRRCLPTPAPSPTLTCCARDVGCCSPSSRTAPSAAVGLRSVHGSHPRAVAADPTARVGAPAGLPGRDFAAVRS